MKNLKQHELEQVAGGADWSKFREYVKDGFSSLGDALSEAGHNIRDDWRAIRNALSDNS